MNDVPVEFYNDFDKNYITEGLSAQQQAYQ